MNIEALIEYWRAQRQNNVGQWIHPDDEHVLSSHPHSFNLDYPLGPFIGDLPNANVVVLGANGGFNPTRTPSEFSHPGWRDEYLARIRRPSTHDWGVVDEYYRSRNYYPLLRRGSLVLVNACAYRSPSISKEPENSAVVPKLPSVQFTRRWLLEAVLPLAASGNRLVVVKRSGLWRLDAAIKSSPGVVVDKAPISPDITGEAGKRTVAA